MPSKYSYKSAGVDIPAAIETKKNMAKSLNTGNPLVLNKIGAFASLCDGAFPGYKHPVLVCKTEEPGSKQLLAFRYNRIPGICADLINHLINDVIVMGAKPMFVQDIIVCGKLEKEVVSSLVEHIAACCKEQGCVLTGGETSEQPGVLQPGTYVLGASCIGVVEKSEIVDGSAIQAGDTVLALESSGLHTNGYTLVRALIREDLAILHETVDGKTFLDQIMTPHWCYYGALKDVFPKKILRGMAHITGGGIIENLDRILPKGTDAVIDASAIKILPIFTFIKEKTGNDDAEMTRTFNLGVGMTVVVRPEDAAAVIKAIKKHKIDCYPIGKIVKGGTQTVRMKGKLKW
ncbi:MAG: phosphoribosylformylglycinamidine cyclo-ligase [Candidatus Peribacteraceae bacterium]|nr:phosphoribosylformylglycinamidine cyclo-ligase [Candidatus Peribacteraceae bacterium]